MLCTILNRWISAATGKRTEWRVFIKVLRSARSLSLPPRENRRITEERGGGERAILGRLANI